MKYVKCSSDSLVYRSTNQIIKNDWIDGALLAQRYVNEKSQNNVDIFKYA